MDRRNPIMDPERGSPTSSRAPSPTPIMSGHRGHYGNQDENHHNPIQATPQTTYTKVSTIDTSDTQSLFNLSSRKQTPRWFPNLPTFTRWVAAIITPSLILAVPVVLFAVFFPDATVSDVRLLGPFIWLLSSWLSLWLGYLLAKLLPYAFALIFGKHSHSNRIYHRVLCQISTPVALLFWAAYSEATVVHVSMIFGHHDTNDVPRWLEIVRLVFMACIVVALLILLERALINLISVNYKMRQLEERGHLNRAQIKALVKLYSQSIERFPPYSPPAYQLGAFDYTIDSGKDVERAPCPTLLCDLTRAGQRAISSSLGKWTHEVGGTQLFNSTGCPSTVVKKALDDPVTSRALGNRLFFSFAAEKADELTLHDLLKAFPSEDAVTVADVFRMLDADENGDLTHNEVVNYCVRIGEERAALDESTRGVDDAVGVLDRFLKLVVIVASILILGAFFSSSFSMYLAVAGAQLVALSFAIGRTVYEVLSSVLFVFVKHPFDIGNRVDISDSRLVVEKISLLYTVFRRVDTGRRLQISNWTLNSSWIENVSRSSSMSEMITIEIDSETSIQDINTLHEVLLDKMQRPENKRDFYPDISLEMLELDNLGKIQLRLCATHKSNWANERLRIRRRNKLMCALLSSTRQVPIYGTSGFRPPVGTQMRPSYQVIVTQQEAVVEQDKFADKLKGKRMKTAEEEDDEALVVTDRDGEDGQELRERK